jgi:glycerophosphoryl diester phosphodiesterase
MLAELPRPIVFAHRGASAHAPENTLAAFQLAAAQQADAIELDVKLSADEEVVVMHDASVDRTTNGHGRVSTLSLRELHALDAGGGQKIPTLHEVFELIGARLLINVELTNYSTPRDSLVERVCGIVKEHALEGSVLFSSFLAANLRQAARILPQVPRGLLALKGLPGVWARSFGFAFGDVAALHPFYTDVSPRLISRVHRLRRRVHAWTVNDPEHLRCLDGWGVDGIFTDDPELALRALRSGA